MDQKTLAALIDKYLGGNASEAEQAELEAWYRGQIRGDKEWMASDFDEKQLLHNEMFEAIQKGKGLRESEATQPAFLKVWKLRPFIKIAAAVILLVALSIGIYLRQRPHARVNIALNTTVNNDSIMPGANGAILTLANGKKILLDQASIGSSLTNEGGIALKKAGDSMLVYQSDNSVNISTAISYNTLETPKGRQFSVVLPDGSRVWLNAASSLKYPTAFVGKERVVELSGEAYFEVVHNSQQPFKVKTSGQLIEDIGTHFNVNAYPDEKGIKTTLLEGAVQVGISETDKPVLLHPGQQALSTGQEIRVSDANLKETVSWKNGYFEFQHEDIHTVMRQVARWYDVEIMFKGDVPQSFFTGDIDRNASISQALEILRFSGAHFSVSGHTVTVTP